MNNKVLLLLFICIFYCCGEGKESSAEELNNEAMKILVDSFPSDKEAKEHSTNLLIQALLKNPKYKPTYYRLHFIYLAKKDYSTVLNMWSAYQLLYPKDGDSYFLQGIVYLCLNNETKARRLFAESDKHYEVMLDSSGISDYVITNMAISRFLLGKNEEGINLLKKYESMFPGITTSLIEEGTIPKVKNFLPCVDGIE